MSRRDPEKHKRWSRKLQEFKASGLSGSQWCRVYGESYSEFSYYKEMCCVDGPVSFQELGPGPESHLSLAPLEISLGPIVIKLTPPFDANALELCLRTLRRA